jgi:addiction module RelE/StbE family toxin
MRRQARFNKSFKEGFEKLPEKQKLKVRKAIRLFLEDSQSATLRDHPLKGEWLKHRSISAGGDLRLHYRPIDDSLVVFVAVGTHSQLYR